ncbi:MAG: sphinganine-1-phosphate aldolase [Gammaproteobacteria bacterium]|jgi:sphinganine-1-phosphate aldolase
MVLPARGRSWDSIQKELTQLRDGDVDWRSGRAAVYVFDPGEDVRAVAANAYLQFISENGLGPAAFPSLARMEAEVVQMTASLLQAPEGSTGNMTSGGTESIFMAVKACRDWARVHRPGAGARPQIVAPRTAHPAFDKAADFLGLEVVRVPVAQDLRADVPAMSAALTARTIMAVGSAPCFPFGLIDPIEALDGLATEHNLWLHVDACVGGYFAPFARMNGVDLAPFDFALSAVQTMSADTHKYGYSAKGASTVLFREPSRHAFAAFHFDDWPCRAMSTPTFAGTRPGGAIASAWSVMNFLGEAGYRERAQVVVQMREELEQALQARELTVFGAPQLGLIAFGSANLDILAVGEHLRQKGWVSSRTQGPDGIHLMLSPGHRAIIPAYLADLDEGLALARSGALEGTAPAPVRYGG